MAEPQGLVIHKRHKKIILIAHQLIFFQTPSLAPRISPDLESAVLKSNPRFKDNSRGHVTLFSETKTNFFEFRAKQAEAIFF